MDFQGWKKRIFSIIIIENIFKNVCMETIRGEQTRNKRIPTDSIEEYSKRARETGSAHNGGEMIGQIFVKHGIMIRISCWKKPISKMSRKNWGN